MKLSDKYAIARAFSAAVNSYDSVACLQKEIGHRLLERLEDVREIKITDDLPKTILDVGSGTGFFSRLLGKTFPEAHIVNLDLSFAMLNRAKHFAQDSISNMSDISGICDITDSNRSSNTTGACSASDTSRTQEHAVYSYLCADAEALPLNGDIIDLIYSNCTLQWCQNYPQIFSNMNHLLKPGGTLLFSTFGPDTLIELRECFTMIDDDIHVNTFTDMHPIGDALLRAQFSYPVVDREIMTLTYSSVVELMKDLKLMGANYVKRDNDNIGLMTKSKMKKLIDAYERFRNAEGLLPASFEVIYGYATKVQTTQHNNGCFSAIITSTISNSAE